MDQTDHTTKPAPAGTEVADPPRNALGGLLGVVRDYPVISGTILACTVVGVGLGIGFLPDDWSLVRRIAGGALGGAGCGLIVTAPRIVG